MCYIIKLYILSHGRYHRTSASDRLAYYNVIIFRLPESCNVIYMSLNLINTVCFILFKLTISSCELMHYHRQ